MAAGRYRLTSSLLIGATLLLVGATGLARISDRQTVRQTAVDLRPFAQAQDGDLVFRAGLDMVSRIVLAQGDTNRYSHVGVIIRRGNDVLVVHALPQEGAFAGGVVLQPLTEFASTENASAVGLYRDEELAAGQRARMRTYLLDRLGAPFDDNFSMKDDDRMYCTELALKAYAAAGKDLREQVGWMQVMTVEEPVVTPDALNALHGLRLVAAEYFPIQK